MKDKLIAKSLYWTDERIDNEFYNGLALYHDRNMKYAIERDDTGYFLTQKDSATYFDLTNGKIWRIDKRWYDKDWECNVAMYNKSTTGGFLVDTPILHDYIDVDGVNCLYTEVQRPFGNLGVDSNMDISEDRINLDYIKEWIDHASIVLTAMKDVAKDVGAGYPRNGLLITHRIRVEDKYSWKTFKRWNADLEYCVKATDEKMRIFFGIAWDYQNAMRSTPYTTEQGLELLYETDAYARNKWNTIINQ